MDAKPIGTRVLLLSGGAVLLTETALWLVGSGHSLVTLGLGRMVEAILILFIVSKFGEGWSSIGLGRSRLDFGLKRGLMWSAGFGIAAALAISVMFFAGIKPMAFFRASLPKDALQLTLFFVVGGVIGPIAEEFFFRGVLYGFFRRWGVAMAVILSTGLFVLPHIRAQTIPLTQAVGGLVFAAAYEIEHNLLVPITIHVLGNLALFALSLAI